METRSLISSLPSALSTSALLTPELFKMKVSVKQQKDPSPSTVNLSLDTFSSLDTGQILPLHRVHSSKSSLQPRLLRPADLREKRLVFSLKYEQRKSRRKKVTSLVHNPLTQGLAHFRQTQEKPLGLLCPERKQVTAHIRSVSFNHTFGVDTVRRTRAGLAPVRTGKVPRKGHWAPLGDRRTASEAARHHGKS